MAQKLSLADKRWAQSVTFEANRLGIYNSAHANHRKYDLLAHFGAAVPDVVAGRLATADGIPDNMVGHYAALAAAVSAVGAGRDAGGQIEILFKRLGGMERPAPQARPRKRERERGSEDN